MTTKTQKNDQLKQNRIRWRPHKKHPRLEDYSIIKANIGIERQNVPGHQILGRREIEAIFRWEDDGGRTHWDR